MVLSLEMSSFDPRFKSVEMAVAASLSEVDPKVTSEDDGALVGWVLAVSVLEAADEVPVPALSID